jgi:hypothetical protein
MSYSNRTAAAASAASTVSELDPSTVEFGDYLDSVYDQNMKQSEAARLKASEELH